MLPRLPGGRSTRGAAPPPSALPPASPAGAPGLPPGDATGAFRAAPEKLAPKSPRRNKRSSARLPAPARSGPVAAPGAGGEGSRRRRRHTPGRGGSPGARLGAAPGAGIPASRRLPPTRHRSPGCGSGTAPAPPGGEAAGDSEGCRARGGSIHFRESRRERVGQGRTGPPPVEAAPRSPHLTLHFHRAALQIPQTLRFVETPVHLPGPAAFPPSAAAAAPRPPRAARPRDAPASRSPRARQAARGAPLTAPPLTGTLSRARQ